MNNLSAIVIARNSEGVIEDCLKSLHFCHEILVIDAESKDKTVSLAKKFDAKIISGISHDFSEQRNIGLKHAIGEWVLYIDTDERVSAHLAQEIKKISDDTNNSCDAYKLKRLNYYFGKHKFANIEHILRLFKKESLIGWKGQLHESPEIKGIVGEADGFLLHYSHRDLSSMVEKTNEWSDIEARLRFDNNHPKMDWWRFYRVMFTAFYDSYIKQQGWKSGTAGLIEGIYQSFSMLVTYSKLWELQNKF